MEQRTARDRKSTKLTPYKWHIVKLKEWGIIKYISVTLHGKNGTNETVVGSKVART